MRTDRLLMLAEKLEKVPEENFDMYSWMEGGSDPNICGTTACALGWATDIPEFRALGLDLQSMRSVNLEFIVRFSTPSQILFGVSAGAAFFDLDVDLADDLFAGPGCTPKQKAQEIRELVAEHLDLQGMLPRSERHLESAQELLASIKPVPVCEGETQ